MKKYLLGAVFSFLILLSPAFASAAGLTSVQIQAIASLLSSFGADQNVIDDVRIALGETLSSTGSSQPWCHTFDTDLTIGSDGEDLKSLRRTMVSLGIELPFALPFVTVDDMGSFSEMTASNVSRFQKQYDIPQTGYVGPLTRAKLNEFYGCNRRQVSPWKIVTQSPTTPGVTSVSPSQVTVGRPTSVTLLGSNFRSTNMIEIQGISIPGPKNVTYVGPTQVSLDGTSLTFTFPMTLATQGDYIVKVYDQGVDRTFTPGVSTFSSSGRVTLVSPYAPTITSISPTIITPGDTVTLLGSNFYFDSKVLIGDYLPHGPGENPTGIPHTPSSYTSNSLSFIIPLGLRADRYNVIIESSNGQISNVIPFTVVAK